MPSQVHLTLDRELVERFLRVDFEDSSLEAVQA